MALQITLVKTPAKISVSKTSQIFGKQGGTLGRGEANVWILPDPDKFLSSCHCEVLFDSGHYYLLDLSTNGTFINNSLDPLGKGSKSLLKNGDFFEIGEYRFAVSLNADKGLVGGSPYAPQPDAAPFANPSDIFGGGDLLGDSLAFADPFSDPEFVVSDAALGFDADTLDPLKFLDGARTSAPESRPTSLFDPITGSLNTYSDESYLGAPTDHSPNMDQAISWPEFTRENLIPEDWGDDLLSSAPPKPLTLDEPLPVVRKTQQTAESIQRPTSTPIEISTPAVAAPVPTPAIVPLPAQQPPAGSAAPNNRLMAAMGLDVDRLSAEQIDDVSDMVGALMRETVNGMMQVLRSRASIKNEFRMNVTTIQPVENNPLKFSVGVDEALENMFIKKTNGYKKPIDAFREGFQEIGEHQVAVIAGIRHGFEKMMDRFNPDSLEQMFNKHGKNAVLPGMQKSKYWRSYKDYYTGFEDNMESSFQHLFGGDFVNAYEDQLRKLTATRKKNN